MLKVQATIIIGDFGGGYSMMVTYSTAPPSLKPDASNTTGSATRFLQTARPRAAPALTPLLLLASCGMPWTPSAGTVYESVLQNVPLGTPKAEATAILERMGFECAEVTGAPGVGGPYTLFGRGPGGGPTSHSVGEPRVVSVPFLNCRRSEFGRYFLVYVAVVDGAVGYGAAFSREDRPISYIDVESSTVLAGMMP